jgi:ABC-type multidrug transport system fused ATPase/permease subunit
MRLFKNISGLLTSREKLIVSLNLVVRLALVVLDLAGIFFVGVVVSLLSGAIISAASPLTKVLDYISSLSLVNPYAVLAVLAVGFFIAKGLLAVFLNRLTSIYVARIEASKSRLLLKNLLKSNLDSLEQFRTQEVVHGLNMGMNSAIAQTLNVGSVIFGEVVLLLAISTYLAITNLGLFLLVGVFFGCVGVVMQFFVGRSAGTAATKFQTANIESQSLITTILDSFRQMQTSGSQEYFESKFVQVRAESAKQQAVYATITTLPRYITEISVMVGAGLLVLQRSTGDGNGISAPVIAVFLAGLFRIVASMLPLQSGLTSIKRFSREAQLSIDMFEIFAPSDVFLGEAPSQVGQNAVEISISDVSYAYRGSSSNIIENATLQIPAGSYVAIVGKSGLGKSTLADLVLGLRNPKDGEITLDGLDPRQYLNLRPGLCGFVPQRVSLIYGTLLENITFTDDARRVHLANLDRALDMSALRDLVKELPEGLETLIGPGGRNLSGGQIQRIGLARALYPAPKLLVLDEATSALDSETESVVESALSTLRGDVTCLVIAHRPATLKNASHVLRFTAAGLQLDNAPD